MLRFTVVVVAAIYLCALAGCFEWKEDQNGKITSAGLPGIPLWTAKKPPPPQGLTDTGLTPDQASKVSGPVLVVPPDQQNQLPRYRYYETGQNNCHQDLAKLQAERGGSNSGGPAPYCTETPAAAAPASKGNAFVF